MVLFCALAPWCEVPVATTNVYLGSSGYKAANAANATPGYCASADYAYDYGGGWNYRVDGCRLTAGSYSELFQKSPGRASFVTFYQESQLENSGAYAPLPTSDYFFPHVEELVVYLDHVMATRVGGKLPNLATTIKGVAGKVLHFDAGATPSVRLGDLLEMAGRGAFLYALEPTLINQLTRSRYINFFIVSAHEYTVRRGSFNLVV